MSDSGSTSADLEEILALERENDDLSRQLKSLREEEKNLLSTHSLAKAEYFSEKKFGQSALIENSPFNPREDREKILLESASRVQYLIDHNLAPSYRVTADGRVIAGNASCAKLFGYDLESFYDGSLREHMLIPKQFVSVERSAKNDFETNIVTRAVVTERIARDGTHVPVAANFRVMKADGSEWCTFMMDLRETKALEEKLWERQSLFTMLVTEMPTQLYLTDQTGRVWHFNRRFFEVTGLDSRQDDGFFSRSAVHPDDVAKLNPQWEECYKNHKPFFGEFRMRSSHGDYYWHVYRAIPLENPTASQIEGLVQLAAGVSPRILETHYTPAMKFWIGTTTDIDERKKVIDDVLESACNFQSLADQIPQILWTAGPDGRIDFFNNRWFEFSGLTRDIGMGLDFALFIHKDDRKNYVAAWKNCIKTGDALDVEFRLKKQSAGLTDFEDQDYETFLARAVAVRGQRGEIEQWVGTWTSI